MLPVEIILEGLEGSVVSRNGFSSPLPDVYGALVYEEASDDCDVGGLNDSYIFVCTEQTLAAAAAAGCRFIFCSVGREAAPLWDAHDCPYSNVVAVAIPIMQLANRINLRIHAYRGWLRDLHTSKDLQEIAEIASQKCEYPIAILNSFFFQNALSFASEPVSRFFRALMADKRIPSRLAKITLDTERDNSSLSYVSFLDSQVRILDYPIRSDGKVIARILVEESPDANHPLAQIYLADFISTVRPLLEVSDSLKKLSMNAISSLFTDIIDQELTDPVEIEERMQFIPDMVKGPVYCPIVIKFSRPGSGIPYNYISGHLEQVFPKCSVASYNSGLVVIAHKDEMTAPLEYDRNHFYELLNRFDAHAGVGNSTYYITALRPLYIEAAAAARLGLVFCEDKNERVFLFEDYCMYFYVDICIEAAVLRHSIRNISYLCEPGLINLMRYDRKNNTHLFETLKGYIDCNCNASLCAQKLFFHRNTVNSRLSLIEDLLGASLDNANLIQKLNFSIKIVEYEIKYLHCDPLEATGKPSLNTDWDHFIPFSEKPKT